MRGGIVSESLVQTLAIDGVALPPTVVQREIQSYVLHRVTIDTSSGEKLHRRGSSWPRAGADTTRQGDGGYV